VPVLLFFVAVIFGILRGLGASANINFTLWESRFLVAMLLAYVLAANTIRTRTHVRTLMTLILVCVGLSGIEGVWRKFALVDAGLLGAVPESWYAHEDVVIWGLMIMLVVAQQIFGGPRWQRIIGPLLVLATGFAMLLSERRAGYVAVILAFVALAIALFVVKRRAFWMFALPVLVAGAVYMPLFWNNTGTLGQPARAIRSISDPDVRDASSNAWRDLEAINVRATIASDPLFGIGFGRPFLQVVEVPNISFFEFWNYESHHDILWVWMKTGALGFVAFFMLMLNGLSRSVWIAKTFSDPEFRIFGILSMSAIIMAFVFCYVDLGLTSSRIPIMLGILLGTVAVLHRIRDLELREQNSSH
jgi:hypothetical protein